jgi:hypothetical protein
MVTAQCSVIGNVGSHCRDRLYGDDTPVAPVVSLGVCFFHASAAVNRRLIQRVLAASTHRTWHVTGSEHWFRAYKRGCEQYCSDSGRTKAQSQKQSKRHPSNYQERLQLPFKLIEVRKMKLEAGASA